MTCDEFLDLLESHGVQVEKTPGSSPPEYELMREDEGEWVIHVLSCQGSDRLEEDLIDAARRKLKLDDIDDDEFFGR
jgi:hypothetical protein